MVTNNFILNLLNSYEAEVKELWEQELESITSYMRNKGYWVGINRLEGSLLYAMIRHFKPEIVMEAGSAHGYSALWQLHALRRNGFGVFYGFEIQPSIHHAREITSQFSDIATFIEGDCTPSLRCAYGMTIGKRYEDLQEHEKNTMERTLQATNGADFIFMDGYHNYEFGKWWTTRIIPYLRKGGIIACHDIPDLYASSNPMGDEYIAVREFVEANPRFKVLQCIRECGIIFLSEGF